MNRFDTNWNRCFMENEKPMTNKIRWDGIGKKIAKNKTNGKYE